MVVRHAAVNVILGLLIPLMYSNSVMAAPVSYAPPVSTPVATPDAAAADPEFIAKGQLDNLGGLDLVTVNETDGTVTVLLNNDDGTFSAPVSYAVGTAPRQAAIGDLNGDGYNDLVIPNTGSGNVTVYLNDGDGTFTQAPESPLALGGDPTSPVIADFDGGSLDVAITNAATDSVHILLGDGDGTFTAGTSIPDTDLSAGLGDKPTYMTAGDLNNDLETDLVVANYDRGHVSVFLGDGIGGFTLVNPGSVGYTLATGSRPWSLHLASMEDTTNDPAGNLDLVLANYNTNTTIRVYKGVGDGTFGNGTSTAAVLSQTNVQANKPHSVEVADLNNDTFVDVVVANDNEPASPATSATTGVTVLLGDGTGAFPTVTHYPLSGQPNGVVSLNLDGANLLDLAVANGSTGNVDVLLSVPTANAPVANNGFLQVATADVPTTNVQSGTLVGTDADGAMITSYAIASQGANGTVAITNPATGTYTYTPAAGNFVPDSFTFTVNDGTGPSAAGTIQVVENDAAPTITSNGGGATASITVNENQTAVTTVTATDADTPPQTLTYSISGGVDMAKFSISSGVLTFASAPNFEVPTDAGTDNVYDVQVQVSDGNGGVDVQDIAVTVADVNEAPVITSNGGGATASITVNENQTAVTTVTATDVDAGQTLAYSISGGPDMAKFSISAGVLTFATAPDFESPTDVGTDNVYDVQVTVTDNGTGTLTDVQDIAVTVANLNDAPVITSNGGGATASLTVNENQTAVTTVTATDADAGQTLSYSIVGGADMAKFSISAGVLTFATAPDFETPTDAGTNNVYDVQVAVTDNGAGTLTDVQDIAVTVADANDLPTINGTPATSTVEGSLYSFTPTANDQDVGDTLSFSITGMPTWASFNTATGALTGTPAYADVATTNGIVISVTDNIAAPVSLASFNLTVTALDSNADGISDGQAIAIGLDPQSLDTDGDTSSDAIEVGVNPAVPVDSDGDGIIDALEFGAADANTLGFVVPAPTATTLSLTDLSGKQVTLSGNGAAIMANNNARSYGLPLYAESEMATADTSFDYPFGVYDFSVAAPAGTATVTLTLPAGTVIPTNAVVRKLSVGNQWRTLDPSMAVINRTANTITLTLTDNDGVFDLDSTAGLIRDPVGVAVPAAAASGGGGGGGCSLSADSRKAGFDPILPLLALTSLLYLWRQRRQNVA